ncbi:MAG: hypothetical protein FWG99_09805 [Treponema sp.]|nr:hypothetical protein [Treponema sp.]
MKLKFLQNCALAAFAAILGLCFISCPVSGPNDPPRLEIVTINDIPGVTPPATGEMPVTEITGTEQYTGTVAWTITGGDGSSHTGAFAASTAYTAIITLTARDGYTMLGVNGDFFNVTGADTVTNAANSGVAIADFPITGAVPPVKIDIAAIPGVTVPATGAVPVTTVNTDQYSGIISWSPAVPAGGVFAASTEYSALITLTAKSGYTLAGVEADFFSVADSTMVEGNAANAGVLTVSFPKTEAGTSLITITDTAIPGVTAPVTGAIPVTEFEAVQYTGTVSWSAGGVVHTGVFAASTVYDAAITILPKDGYTLLGVTAGFFTVAGSTVVTPNAADSGVLTITFQATGAAGPTTISIADIQGITAPVTGAMPATAITATTQYTGSVAWTVTSGGAAHSGAFAASTSYTATITLSPTTGFTLTGVAADYFTVAGANPVNNPVNSGEVTAVFPATGPAVDDTINIAAIPGVTAPVTGETPVTAITPTAQYTGTVEWTVTIGGAVHSGAFAASTSYTATITLSPTAGFTLTGVTADFFTVAGAPAGTTVNNAADSGTVIAVFPATVPAVINIPDIPGVTRPATGGSPVAVITATAQYTGTVEWTVTIGGAAHSGAFAASTSYTATITLAPTANYTLTGVAADYFRVAQATTVTNAAGSGVVTAVFPDTSAPAGGAPWTDTDPLTSAEITTVAALKVFFAHASVGENTLFGLNRSVSEITVYNAPRWAHENGLMHYLNVTINGLDHPAIVGYDMGPLNMYPETKMTVFESAMDDIVQNNVDIAFMKFCPLDIQGTINGYANEAAMFTAYSEMIARLKVKHPDVFFVHATLPLYRDGNNWQNPNREIFNGWLRDTYGELVFDVAAIESIRSDGTTAVGVTVANGHKVLADEWGRPNNIAATEFLYSLGGGASIGNTYGAAGNDGDTNHLNIDGQNRMGQSLVKFLAWVSDEYLQN